jgi:glyoxylase-like metal-dependent hydrolase (beta-lactamase superfamily II)
MTTNVSFASASDTREQKPRLRELAPGVHGYISDFDPNCGFVVGDEQVVLIDTRPTPRMARDFLAAIRTVTDKPIKTIVLTHYHAVRVMGASAFDEVEQVIAATARSTGSARAARRTSIRRWAGSRACSRAWKRFRASPFRR